MHQASVEKQQKQVTQSGDSHQVVLILKTLERAPSTYFERGLAAARRKSFTAHHPNSATVRG